MSDDIMVSPWLFQHDDLIKELAAAPVIDKKKLVNILNYTHFMGGHVFLHLRHPDYDEGVLVRAYPEPCLGEELRCLCDQSYGTYNLERYHFQHLIIPYNQSFILAPALPQAAANGTLTVRLPETSHAISERQTPRFVCRDVKAELFQDGFQASGKLLDFSSRGFRIKVKPVFSSSFHWFNADRPATVRLSGGEEVYFSGSCRCLYQSGNVQDREIILSPPQDEIKRFREKKVRNPRTQPPFPFTALFRHPFSRKMVQREIFDISTSGFSLIDKSEEVVLMPGLIIPEMTVVYAGVLKIQCKVQVIYRRQEEDRVRLGIAILDMDLRNYNKLAQVVQAMTGSDSGMVNDVDLDELWEFLFDANFIYPEKYKFIQSFKNDFRSVYRKLYEEAPEIAKHFTYQKNGRIYGHVSMLRAYERTWMVHHHAARPVGGRPIGLVVLKQLIYYLNDCHRLPSANMDYIMTYFRPGNKFPQRIFGGYAEAKADPQACSLDIFGYLIPVLEKDEEPLPPDWTIKEGAPSDYWKFEQFYRNRSGGLFWSVINPECQNGGPALEETYAGFGITRRWKSYALACAGELKAFIIAEESDSGINLSELLNGFKVFVIDPGVSPEVLFSAVSRLEKNHDNAVPMLIYPTDYIHNAGIICNKQYCLWILDVQQGNEYLGYLARKFRLSLG